MERRDVVRMLRDLTLLLPLSTTSIWEVVEKHNHCRSNQDTRRRERLDADGGLGLHTHLHTHTYHFTAITLSLNLKCRVIGMITWISSLSFPIPEGVGYTCWPQKESKTTLQHDLYRHLYKYFFFLLLWDLIILCSLSVNTKVD